MHRTKLSTVKSGSAPREQLQFSVASLLALTGRLWRTNCTERLKGLNQSEARWSALFVIADAQGGIIQTHLAERLGIQGPTLVRLLDALEKEGLVSRHTVFNDRRANMIALEPKGRATLDVSDDLVARMRSELFAGVTEAELTTTLRVLRHLSHQLGPEPHAA
mgnify:CR=1 FL=1